MSEATVARHTALPTGFLLRLFGKLSAEVGPLLIFFLAYGWWDIIVATGAYAASTVIALTVLWLTQRRLPILPLLSTVLVAVFAALTIALDNAFFIKIKPTVVNGFYAVLIGGGWLVGVRLIRRVLAPAVVLDEAGERMLTWRTAGYLAFLAVANEVIWRSFPLDVWVLFKVFISIALNLLFVLIQLPLVRRHRIC